MAANDATYTQGPAPIPTGLTINEPGDRYEQEAERVADHVVRLATPVSRAIASPGASSSLHRNPVEANSETTAPGIVQEVVSSPGRSLDPATRAYMEPRFGYDLSSVRIHDNSTAGHSAHAIQANAYTAGNNIVFGPGRYAPGTLSGDRLLAHELTHVIQQSQGTSTPRAEIQLSPAAASGRSGLPAQTSLNGLPAAISAAPARVIQRDNPELEKRRDEIHQLQEHHARHDKIDGAREEEVKLHSIGTLQQVINKLSGATGTEINAAVSELMRNLDAVKNARYRGFQDAIGELALKLSDPDPVTGNQRSFLLSLAGNLLWALSGLIAITPAGLEARLTASLLGGWKGADVSPLVQKLVAVYNRRRAFLSIAAGTGGAMLAQFASGLPSIGSPGSKVSNGIIQVKDTLDRINSSLFADMDLEIYSLMLTYLDFDPKPSLGAAHLVANMIQGVRAVTLSGYVESGRIRADDGDRIDEPGIAQDARDSVLRAWVVQAAGLRDGHLVATNLTRNGSESNSGRKLVASALELHGGEDKLNLQRYELVFPKLRQAATIFGCQVSIDEKAIENQLLANKTVTLPVASWDRKALNGDTLYSLWEAKTLEWESLDTSGTVPPVSRIYSMEVSPSGLSSATIKGRNVFSLDKVAFNCRTGYGGTEYHGRNESDFQIVLHFDSSHDMDGIPPV